ncbi:FAD-binding oxidoreductase, partial [Sphingomonas sp. Leaf412]|uniref:FAD-binding oxidoreductase n=1 Tax=Sphingomonas sp. Leaf412 TaxID=1736370 RepID=UPI0012E373F7
MHHFPYPERAPLDPAFLHALDIRFGADCHVTEGVRRQHGRSEAHFAETLPDAVVFVATTQDVADCVTLCARYGVPVVPWGAGTSIEGNALPIRGGVSLDMSRMDRIVAVNAADFDCTVEAG